MGNDGVGKEDSSVAEYMNLVGQRVDFLEYLCENAAQKRDLIDDLDVSRSTVDRALDELQDAGLVTYDDGAYETSATGVIAVKQYRAHIDESADIRAAHDALRPLPPDTRLDPAMAVGASVTLTEEPRPYQALQPLASSLRDATRIRALLPNIADSRHVELYHDRVRSGADVEMVLSPKLSQTLTNQFPTACQQIATHEEYAAYEGDVPPFGVVLTDGDGVTAVSVVVYTENGSVHSVIHTGTLDAVQWAENLYENTVAEAAEVTASFRELDAGEGAKRSGDSGDTIINAATDEPSTAPSTALPVELQAEGFTRLTPQYFDQREASDPVTCWRTGLRLVDVAAGFAVDRTHEQNDERVSVTGALLETLREGTDHVVLGPLGAGKSTVCKSVAYRWYNRQLGPVIYREGGRMDAFESVAQLKSAIEQQTGHVLVVVEDAVRPEASAAFELAQQLDGNDTVTFLFDARESEWENPDVLPVDARLESYRAETIETVRLPVLDETECARFINHFEDATGISIPTDAAELLGGIRRDTPDSDARRGEVLLLFHRLARYAQPSVDADETTSTALLEDVRRTHEQLAESDDPYALEVGVLVNLLNAAQVGVYPEYIHAIADTGDHEAVERQLESLQGSVLFQNTDTTSYVAPQEAVHEAWSAEFLLRLLDMESQRRSHRIIGDCISAVLSLADDRDRREEIEWFFEGQTNRLDDIEENPTEWSDTLIEQLFSLGIKRPALAPLFGKSGYSRFSLPDACSDETRLRCSLWRGQMNQNASNYDRAEHEYEHLIEAIDEVELGSERAASLQAEANRRLGRVLWQQGELDAAEDRLTRADELYRELDDMSGVADSLLELSYVSKTRGDLDVTKTRLEDALTMFEQVEDRDGLAECLLERGMLAHRRGSPDEGHEYVSDALEIYRDIDSRSDEARCYNGLGTIAAQQGQFEEAKTSFSRSVEIARDVGDRRREANSLNNLARTLGMAGEYEAAEEYQTEAADIYQDIGERNGEAAAYHNLGETAREQGNLDTAEDRFQKAIEIRREIDHNRRMYRSIHNLGVVHLKRDEYEAARDHLLDALEKFREFEEPRREGASLLRLGELAIKTDDLEEARHRTERAVECCREANAQDFLMDGLEQLIEICEELGEMQRAVEYCKEAAELAETAEMDERYEELVDTCNRLEGAVAAD